MNRNTRDDRLDLPPVTESEFIFNYSKPACHLLVLLYMQFSVFVRNYVGRKVVVEELKVA